MTDADDWKIYQVERAIKHMTRARVTSTRNSDHVLFVIDFRWEFRVDEDNLHKLWNCSETPSEFLKAFDKMGEANIRLSVLR